MKLKKLFAGLISIAAGLLAVGAISVCAGAEELTSGYWQYEVQDDNTVYVTGYTGFTDKLTIPSKIAGKTVSGIDDYAFQKSDSFNSVVIPSTVKYIGYQAFAGTSIKSIAIPSSVTSWGYDSYEYLPDGSYQSSYASFAFAQCNDLTTVTVNSSVIPNNLFYDCESLTTATISSTEVGEYAFNECDSLSTVKLGSKTTSIKDYAFSGDAAIQSFSPTSQIKEIGDKSFRNCKGITSFTFGSKLESIGYQAFAGSGLKSVTIPSSVKTWGTDSYEYLPDGSYQSLYASFAFSQCDNLTTATVNSNLAPAAMFYDNTALKTVTVNSSEIGDYAFNKCENLSKVTLGSNVKYLGSYAFSDDVSLSTVTTNGNLLEIGYECFRNCSSLGSISLGNRLYSIGYQAFAGSGLKTVTIPSTVTSWGTDSYEYLPNGSYSSTTASYAFAQCNDLTSIYFGYGTTGANLLYGSNNAIAYCFPGSDALTFVKENNIPYALRTAISATSIKLNKTSAILEVGEELVLDATVSPSNSNDGVTWTSGDDDVAECRSGIIYARSEGIAAIRAKTTSGKIAVCNVTVINKKPVDVAAIALSSRGSSTLTIKWTPTDTADGYIVEKYIGGKWTRAAKISSKATSAYTVNGLKPSTKYSIRVRSYKMVGSTAVYSAYKSGSWTTNPSAVSGLKLKGRSSDALRLSWTKNTSADGYIIERKDGSKWVRVVKITKNSTTEYRIAKLKAGTTYNFRIRTYNMVGSTPLYSGYKTISACTKPSNISGLRLKAAVSNAVRLAWSKNTSADGYIIEMKSGSKWVRVGKITKNSTVEFRKSGLKSKTSYTFRVQAYKMSGKTALYGATKTITVKTK